MQQAPRYDDVLGEVMAFFEQRLAACRQVGIAGDRVLLDPGFGFGKTAAHNLTLLRDLARFARIRRPLVVGLSRKSLIGDLTGAPVAGRLGGSIALAVLAAERGLRLLRVHDVEATVQAGTHVGNTAEIGAVRVARIEKKSARTRRVVLEFASPLCQREYSP
jgi:dihydropteroate synthase